MASITSNKLRQLLLQGASGSPDLDLLGDAIKVALVGAAYTPDPDHAFADAITATELSGTGYTAGFGGAGRKTLASRTVTLDDATNKSFFDAADVVWTAINAGTVAWAVVLKEVTNDADSPILVVVDISPDVVTNGGNYTIAWAADGILNLT